MSTADVERNPAPDGADVRSFCLVAGLRSGCCSVVVAGRALATPSVMALDIDPEGFERLLNRRTVNRPFLERLDTVARQPVSGVQIRHGEHFVPEGADSHAPEVAKSLLIVQHLPFLRRFLELERRRFADDVQGDRSDVTNASDRMQL